jgi:hypothetical protein
VGSNPTPSVSAKQIKKKLRGMRTQFDCQRASAVLKCEATLAESAAAE